MGECVLKTGLKEECGVFGIFNAKENSAAENVYLGLHSLQHRGQEACGIYVTGENNEFDLHKNDGLVHTVFDDEKLRSMNGKNAIGHVRYSTFGGSSYNNIQPFVFFYGEKNFGLCHNGNIVNSKELKTMLEQSGSLFQATSDSEVVAHLMKQNVFVNPMEAIKECLNYVIGAFVFLILIDGKLYCARDKNGLRPLSIGMIDDAYVVASETCALDAVGAEFLRDLKPGEVIEISEKGIRSEFYADETKMSLCAMEYIYFSRPDSDLEGVNVHLSRKEAGKCLAKIAPQKADLVIGVPDSSISAAIGYSEVSGIPYDMGLVKNKYMGRTFIEPTQFLRERAVSLKLTAVRKVVENKDIILIDDSIVRGTTLRRIVKILKEVNCGKIHIRISSPPIKYPCFYGVDTGTFEELIMNRMSKEELCNYLGADSLEFLGIEDIKKSTGHNDLCFACFNGEYVTPTFNMVQKEN